jgi:hypothetical protein
MAKRTGNPGKARFVKISDMDQDGYNDLISSNNDAGSISVLLNKDPWH